MKAKIFDSFLKAFNYAKKPENYLFYLSYSLLILAIILIPLAGIFGISGASGVTSGILLRIVLFFIVLIFAGVTSVWVQAAFIRNYTKKEDITTSLEGTKSKILTLIGFPINAG